jgi:hypothetical protein
MYNNFEGADSIYDHRQFPSCTKKPVTNKTHYTYAASGVHAGRQAYEAAEI